MSLAMGRRLEVQNSKPKPVKQGDGNAEVPVRLDERNFILLCDSDSDSDGQEDCSKEAVKKELKHDGQLTEHDSVR